jgi:NADH:ubiquinone oxidoreductase subunit 3 (subunit A)
MTFNTRIYVNLTSIAVERKLTMKIEFLLRFFTEVWVLALILSLFSRGCNVLLHLKLPYKPDSVSGYESGLYTTKGAREKDRISFYTLALTFLIFDLELLLIFPFLFTITFGTNYTFLCASIFLSLLALDFF